MDDMALTSDIFFSFTYHQVLMTMALTNPPCAACLLWILHVLEENNNNLLVYHFIALQWNTSKPGVCVGEGDMKHAG